MFNFKKAFTLYFLLITFILAACSPSTDKPEEEEPVDISEPTDEQIVSGIDLTSYYQDEDLRDFALSWIGEEAPDFSLTNTNSDEISLSDYKGQNVILELGLTTCSFCQDIHSEVDRFKSLNTETVVLQAFPNNSLDEVISFLELTESEASSELLTGETQNSVLDDYRIQVVPTLYFIDKSGTVQFVHVGSLDAEILETLNDVIFNGEDIEE